MGYLFLFIGVISSVSCGYFGKVTSRLLPGIQDSILSNILRMMLCSLFGFVVLLLGGHLAYIKPSPALLLIAALSGACSSIGAVIWLVVVKRSAYMLLDVFFTLSVLVPLLASLFLFAEPISVKQWIGVAVLITAVTIMCSYNNQIKEKLSLSSLALLTAMCLLGGLGDFSQKLFVNFLPDVPVAAFNFYAYAFATLTLIFPYCFLHAKGHTTDWKGFRKAPFLILGLAVSLFVSTFFRTQAAARLDSVLLYPLNQGSHLILSAAMSAVVFREKLTRKGVIGLITVALGLFIINVL